MSKEVLLAKKWEGENVTGWWCSEKLDGVRAIWTGTAFESRNGKPFYAPDWFIKDFPNKELDGELFVGRKKFNQTVSAIKKKIPVDREWKKVLYMVFDAPGVSGPFESRMRYYEKIRAKYIKPVKHIKIKNNDEVNIKLKKIESKGGEGLMLRKPSSRYERKRSKTLLKVKSFLDSEVVVIDYQPGVGRNEGRLGALICELPNGTNVKVGTGFTDKERKNPPKIGSTITIKYQELTPKGVPRFPSFDRERTDAAF